MSEHDEPLTSISAELETLRSTLEQLRAGVTAAPAAISDIRAGRAPIQSPGSQLPTDKPDKALRLLSGVGANLTRIRSALRLVEGNIAALEAARERAEAEVWQHRAQRADATARLKLTQRLLAEIQESALWKIVKPLWKLLRRTARSKSNKPLLSTDLRSCIDAPRDWHVNSSILVVRGWCLSISGRNISGVRAKIGRKGRIGRYGINRDDLRLSGMHGASSSGFTIEIPLPRGTSTVQLEAIVQGGEWEPFFSHRVERVGNASDQEEIESNIRQAVASDALPRLTERSATKVFGVIAPPLQRIVDAAAKEAPFFSIITPTFNTQPRWLGEAALSLLQQTFTNWEWCIVDDGSSDRETRQLIEQLSGFAPRVRIALSQRAGISSATNQALDLARGEFVCFLDHDDLLAPDALKELEREARAGFDVVYSDEDKLEDQTGALLEPFFKPDWSPEYFRGAMYVGHLLCVRRELATRVRFNPQFDGVQDFEFMLRVSETGAKIGHVPKVLYHWRKTPGSIAADTEGKPEIANLQQRAVNAHLSRLKLSAAAEKSTLPHRLRIVPTAAAGESRISIIIPTKDAPELLERCLRTLFEKTAHKNFEVILVDNGTEDAEALRLMQQYPVRQLELPGPFNFSRANNRGAELATGSLLVFLNNDTEIVTPDWLKHLAYYSEQEDVGAAGALLLYPDGTVQHAGVALGMRGTADHVMRGFPDGVDGYAGSLACAREVSAVAAACMMMRECLFQELGGFNEHFFTAYQDLDLCLRLRARGLRLIYTPQAKVVHHESASRKRYYDMVDRMLVLDQWEPLIRRGDSYYNRNLNLERGDYSPARAS